MIICILFLGQLGENLVVQGKKIVFGGNKTSYKVFWLIFKIPIDVYFTSGNKLGNSEILHATLLILFVSQAPVVVATYTTQIFVTTSHASKHNLLLGHHQQCPPTQLKSQAPLVVPPNTYRFLGQKGFPYCRCISPNLILNSQASESS